MKKMMIISAISLVILVSIFALRKINKSNVTAQNIVFDNPISRSAFRQAGLSNLHVAVIKGDNKTVKELLDKGADPNDASLDGASLLHSACSFGHIQCVKLLLEHGANIEARDKGGNTPLSTAAMAGYPDIVELLLNYGANIDVRNNKNRTPLQAVFYFKEVLLSNTIARSASSEQRKKLDQCAQILRNHGAK